MVSPEALILLVPISLIFLLPCLVIISMVCVRLRDEEKKEQKDVERCIEQKIVDGFVFQYVFVRGKREFVGIKPCEIRKKVMIAASKKVTGDATIIAAIEKSNNDDEIDNTHDDGSV